MPKIKTELEKMLGKLISEIQKEWGEELGEPRADISEEVMNRAHELLQAGTAENIEGLIKPLTITQYLGEVWVQGHPKVKAKVMEIERYLVAPEK